MTNQYLPAHAVAEKLSGRTSCSKQHGVTLIELLVGLAIGLLVIAVATSSLMVSRGVSGTVSDASTIQQQAAYGLRVIGMQMRQAGSLFLNPDASGITGNEAYLQPVAFETQAVDPGGTGLGFNPVKDTVSATSDSLTVGFRRYKDKVYNSADEQALMRNCLGGPANDSADLILQSEFKFDNVANELRCNGNNAGEQPILRNVAEFQWRYLVQNNSAPGSATIQYTSTPPTDALGWSRVQAVEVCMVLYGNEAIDVPAGSEYTACDGTTKVDMSTLTGVRAKRMHVVFRNVFQLRSQGLVGTAIPAI
ncbi:MAG: PilW family protein [Giesbergeria sp.]